METIDFISAFKRQRGNLAGLEYLFGMYFEINKNVGFEDLENYSEIIKEYLDWKGTYAEASYHVVNKENYLDFLLDDSMGG